MPTTLTNERKLIDCPVCETLKKVRRVVRVNPRQVEHYNCPTYGGSGKVWQVTTLVLEEYKPTFE